MWPFSAMSLAAASFWNNVANVGLLGSAILLFLATFVLWQTADRKEHLWDAAKDEANLKIAELNHETAAAKLETERVKARFAWRTISSEQKNRIAEKIKKFAGQEFVIVTTSSDPEIGNFGGLINQVLTQSGWKYLSNIMVSRTQLNTFFETAPGAAAIPAAEAVRAMNDEKLIINQTIDPNSYNAKPNVIFVVVGAKEPHKEDMMPTTAR